jgi:hypothetical protein
VFCAGGLLFGCMGWRKTALWFMTIYHGGFGWGQVTVFPRSEMSLLDDRVRWAAVPIPYRGHCCMYLSIKIRGQESPFWGYLFSPYLRIVHSNPYSEGSKPGQLKRNHITMTLSPNTWISSWYVKG